MLSMIQDRQRIECLTWAELGSEVLLAGLEDRKAPDRAEKLVQDAYKLAERAHNSTTAHDFESLVPNNYSGLAMNSTQYQGGNHAMDSPALSPHDPGPSSFYAYAAGFGARTVSGTTLVPWNEYVSNEDALMYFSDNMDTQE